jgi:hypothetical protein
MEKSKTEKIADIVEHGFFAVEWYGQLTSNGKYGLIVRVDQWNDFTWLTAQQLITACRINGMQLTVEEAEEFISLFDE